MPKIRHANPKMRSFEASISKGVIQKISQYLKH